MSHLPRWVVGTLLCSQVVPAPGLATTFTDVARDSDIYVILQPSACGAGVSIADVNGDGLWDVFMTDGPALPRRLWINQGGLLFQEEASQWGLSSVADGRCGVFADIDNDGDQDLFLGNWAGGNQLYRNDGQSFTDITAGSGLGILSITNGAAWGDIDDDGLLDLFVCVYDDLDTNRLFRNLGGGVFQDITAAAGVSSADLSFQPVFTDYDRDGDLDVFVTNDKDFPNLLWRNDGGNFVEVAASAGVAGPFWAMGTAVGDFDHSGTMDFYVTNIPDGNYFYTNTGTGTFLEASAAYQVEMNRFGWATEFLDYDNDGDEDLYVVNFALGGGVASQNALFRNDGAVAPMVEVATTVGTANAHPGFGAAVADLDGDGYQEIVVANYLEFTNLFRSSGGANNWLEIQLVGSASNRDGVGAWVTIDQGPTSQHREIRAGSGYLSQSPPVAHFGLGPAGAVDRVEIRWPSGQVQVLGAVSVNQRLTVLESSPVAAAAPRAGLAVERVAPNPFNPQVTVTFRAAAAREVRLAVHDAAGRRVRDLGAARWEAGPQVVRWDGRDDRGRALSSGVYHLRAVARGLPPVTAAVTLVR